jgi:hypothetical protein
MIIFIIFIIINELDIRKFLCKRSFFILKVEKARPTYIIDHYNHYNFRSREILDKNGIFDGSNARNWKPRAIYIKFQPKKAPQTQFDPMDPKNPFLRARNWHNFANPPLNIPVPSMTPPGSHRLINDPSRLLPFTPGSLPLDFLFKFSWENPRALIQDPPGPVLPLPPQGPVGGPPQRKSLMSRLLDPFLTPWTPFLSSTEGFSDVNGSLTHFWPLGPIFDPFWGSKSQD